MQSTPSFLHRRLAKLNDVQASSMHLWYIAGDQGALQPLRYDVGLWGTSVMKW